MKYTYLPPDQLGLLKWGLSEDEVSVLVWPPEKSSKIRGGETRQIRHSHTVSFIFGEANSGLVEVASLSAESDIEISGIQLVEGDSEDVVQRLLRIDPVAYQGFGTIVFPKLGVALTGYVPEDKEIRAASVFVFGRWDALAKKMKPFRMP